MRIILLFGLLFNITAFAQEKQSFSFDKQVIYKMRYQSDSTDKNSVKEEYMELLINDSNSLFESVNKGIIDSIENQKAIGGSHMPGHQPYIYFHYQILKYNDTITTFDVFDNEPQYRGPNHYFYSESKNALNWELKEDTLRINNLLCQKAELDFGNRKWIAWFAAEIPIADGPYKFCDLPGLIVKVNDTQGYWEFELVQLNTVSKVVTINFKKDKLPEFTTKQEFFKNKQHFKNNQIQISEMYGLVFMDNESRMMIQKNVEDHNKRDNNWIELPL